MKFNRYRLYYFLMNVALAGVVFGLIDSFIVSNLNISTAPSHPTLDFAYKSLGIIIILLPVFLILAKFMRDDYANQIWSKTATSFLYFFTAFPLLFILPNAIVWIASAIFSSDVSANVADLVYNRSPFAAFYDKDAYTVVANSWLICVSFFVILFQWHRWRDAQ